MWRLLDWSLYSKQHGFISHKTGISVIHMLLCWFVTRWRSWLRHCSTIRKGVVSIPDGVFGIFHRHNPSGRNMTLGSNEPLIEISTRNMSWGKGGQCIGLTTLPPSRADCLQIVGASTSRSRKGFSRPVEGQLCNCCNIDSTILHGWQR